MHDPLGLRPLRGYGVISAFGKRPDLVTGLATSTRAGTELVRKLSGIPALNVLDRESFPQIRTILDRTLALREVALS